MISHTTRASALLTFATASMLLLGGCHKKESTPPPYVAPPAAAAEAPTATLEASPATIDLGQSVVLTWHTTNATSASIDGIGSVNLNGTMNVTPSNSTNFHLVATGDGGTADANFRVTVRVPAPPVADTGTSSNLPDDATFHAAVPDIFFGYDSYDVDGAGQSAAQKASSYLVQHPNIRVVIGGYCDERGSAEYNLALGENRATAAKTALVNGGVPADRIRVISYGKEKQFCTEQSESCWQQNRRAQFNLDR